MERWERLLHACHRLFLRGGGVGEGTLYPPRMRVQLPTNTQELGLDLFTGRAIPVDLEVFWSFRLTEGRRVLKAHMAFISRGRVGSAWSRASYAIGGVGGRFGYRSEYADVLLEKVPHGVWRHCCWWFVTATRHWVSLDPGFAHGLPFGLVAYEWREREGKRPSLTVLDDSDNVVDVVCKFPSPLPAGVRLAELKQEVDRG